MVGLVVDDDDVLRAEAAAIASLVRKGAQVDADALGHEGLAYEVLGLETPVLAHAPRGARLTGHVAEALKDDKCPARHSTPTLTLGRYAHVQLVDQTRALDALPAIKMTRPDRQTAKATGTDGVAASSAASERAAPGAARRVPDTAKLAITGQDGEAQEDDAEGAQTPAKATTYAHLSTRVIGAPGPIRTGNLRIRSPRLYPLSYGRDFLGKRELYPARRTKVKPPPPATPQERIAGWNRRFG